MRALRAPLFASHDDAQQRHLSSCITWRVSPSASVLQKLIATAIAIKYAQEITWASRLRAVRKRGGDIIPPDVCLPAGDVLRTKTGVIHPCDMACYELALHVTCSTCQHVVSMKNPTSGHIILQHHNIKLLILSCHLRAPKYPRLGPLFGKITRFAKSSLRSDILRHRDHHFPS